MSTLDHTLTAALDELGRAGRSAFLVSIGVGGRFTTPSALRYLNNSDCSGLIIEAEPVLFERLRTGAGARPHVHLEHVAVAADDGEMELLTIPPRAFEAGGAPPVLVGLASQIPVRAAAHSASYRAMADKWGRLVRVPALSVETLLTRYQVRHIDLLQIDAAGYEWPIFNQFDLEHSRRTHRPDPTGRADRPGAVAGA
jgi:FkbM family methyltransferase